MSSNFDNKDIEQIIFKDRLESSEIEPSEKFWNKAFEGIFQRENHIGKIRTARWRTAFFIMGTTTLFLGSYIIYMNREFNDIRKELTLIKTASSTTNQQELTQNSVTNKEKRVGIPKTENPESSHRNVPLSGSAHTVIPGNSVPSISLTQADKSPGIPTKILTIFTSIPLQNPNTPLLANNSESFKRISQDIIVNRNNTEENNTGTNVSQPGITSTSKSAENGEPAITKSNRISSVPLSPSEFSRKKTDSISSASSIDSINSLYQAKKPVTLAGILSKMSVSVFYAPGFTDNNLSYTTSSKADKAIADGISQREIGDGPFATGFLIGYNISSNWTIQTGCYYRVYSYDINPATIYAQQQENGQVGYSLPTSSGTVAIPYSAGPLHAGDSLEIGGTSSRGYISIPLQVKYEFWGAASFGFYITGGVSANMLVYKIADLNWQNAAFQEGEVRVRYIYGLQSMRYSYNLGFGASYLISRGLSIYAEPYVDGSITAVTNNTPVSAYPYFFGMRLGLSYHF